MSLDLGRVERASKALAAAMEAGNTLPYSLAMALELAGLLAPTDLATAVAEHGPFPMPAGTPTPAPGELAEQRHLVDPLDHQLEHLADERPTVTESEAREAVDRSVRAQFPAVAAFLAAERADGAS